MAKPWLDDVSGVGQSQLLGPEQHQPSCGLANTRQVVGGARREHPYLAPPDLLRPPRNAVRAPRLVEDNYLEELVPMGPIGDNNVMLIEALHLGAHEGW